MSFKPDVKEQVLIACARHCSICHRYKGLKIEIHHIIPESEGGPSTFDNAIALCFDCHSDAGHYNANHPRGTKFSRSELVKARDNWYEIVKAGKIQQPTDFSNHLHFRHLICRSTSESLRIISGDLRSIPVKDALLVNNEILPFFKWYEGAIKEFYSRGKPESRSFKDANDYLKQYPEAEIVDKSNPENAYFECERVPTVDELLEKFNLDLVQIEIIKSGAPPKDVCRVNARASLCGSGSGDKPYVETLRFRPIWFCFLLVTNASDTSIVLKGIDGLYNDQVGQLNYLNDSGGYKPYHFQFPETPIRSNESVLIPTGLILVPFKGFDVRGYTIDSQKDFESVRLFSVISNAESAGKDFQSIGPFLKGREVMYKSSGELYVTPIHKLDFQKLYILSADWQAGCCPHLFWIGTDGKPYYSTELFAAFPGTVQEHEFVVPTKTCGFIIAELEYETSHLESVSINDANVISDRVMVQGDIVELKVQQGDVIRIKGSYNAISRNIFPDAIIQRNAWVGAFMSSFENRNSVESC